MKFFRRRFPKTAVNHKRVARVMREHSITGIVLRKKVQTTVPGMLAAYEVDPALAELQPDLRSNLESAVATLITGALVRSGDSLGVSEAQAGGIL